MTIECRIAKRIYKVGEAIPLRIEIRNRSNDSLLVDREVPDANTTDSPTSLAVSLLDTQDQASPAVVKTGQFLPTPDESDAVAVARWWVLLEPDSFYGRIIRIHTAEFEFLKKPGKYRFQVTLSSIGGYPPTMASRLTSGDPNIPKVPYPIWTGKFKCTSDWLEIRK